MADYEPVHFKPPEGRLQSSMFPEADLDVLLNAWINDAESRVADHDLPETATDGVKAVDEAEEAWVYFRAFQHITDRMEVSPMSASIDGKGSMSREGSQIRAAQRKADTYRGRFEHLINTYERDEPYRQVTYTI